MDETGRATARRVVSGLAPVLVEVVVPLAVFGVLRLAGVSTVAALVAAGCVSVVTLVVGVVRSRRVSAQTVLTAALLAAGLVVTALTHDPRVLLVKASVVFVAVGATMLVSAATRRPLFYDYLRPLAAARHADGGAGFDAAWAGCAAFRRPLRRMTAVWGVTWLVESAVRVAIVYAFPVERAGTALLWCTLAIPVLLAPAIVVSTRDGRAVQRAAESFHAARAPRSAAGGLVPGTSPTARRAWPAGSSA